MTHRRPDRSAACLLLLLAACDTRVRTDRSSMALPPAQPPARLEETLAPVATDPVALTTVLYSERDAEVGSRMDGVVVSIHAELGDVVPQGQELARLDDGEERAALTAASVAREMAALAHERSVHLAEQRVIAQVELETASYRLRAAEASLSEAGARLQHTRVRAPFAGTVTRRFVHVGESVGKGEPLFRVTALRPLRALVRVPELQSLELRAGQPVRLRGITGEEIRGAVLRIAPAVDPVSGTVEVLVDVPDPGGLRPGSAVEVRFGPTPPR